MTCRLTQSKSPEKWVDQFIENGFTYREMVQLVDLFNFTAEKVRRIRLEYMRRILKGEVKRHPESDEHDTGGFRVSNKEARQARLRLVVDNVKRDEAKQALLRLATDNVKREKE